MLLLLEHLFIFQIRNALQGFAFLRGTFVNFAVNFYRNGHEEGTGAQSLLIIKFCLVTYLQTVGFRNNLIV